MINPGGCGGSEGLRTACIRGNGRMANYTFDRNNTGIRVSGGSGQTVRIRDSLFTQNSDEGILIYSGPQNVVDYYNAFWDNGQDIDAARAPGNGSQLLANSPYYAWSGATWKFVLLHCPPYTHSNEHHYGSDSDQTDVYHVRKQLAEKLFNKSQVRRGCRVRRPQSLLRALVQVVRREPDPGRPLYRHRGRRCPLPQSVPGPEQEHGAR